VIARWALAARAILRASGDERQRGLDGDATAITGLVMSGVAVFGAIVEIGRTGNPGVWGTMGRRGVRYTISLAVLRRSR